MASITCIYRTLYLHAVVYFRNDIPWGSTLKMTCKLTPFHHVMCVLITNVNILTRKKTCILTFLKQLNLK